MPRSKSIPTYANCEVCNVSFQKKRSPQQRFCSIKCSSPRAHPRNGETRACKTCGKSFYRPASELKRSHGLYCSRACYTPEDRRANELGKNLGRQFTEEKKLKKRGPRPHRIRTYTYVCQHCEISFQHNGKRARNQRFCSVNCWYEHVRANPEASPSYIDGGGRDRWNKGYGPNWDRIAAKARERDGYTCQRCGLHQMRPALPVHHIIPFRMFGADNLSSAHDMDNLITLCQPCHVTVERLVI